MLNSMTLYQFKYVNWSERNYTRVNGYVKEYTNDHENYDCRTLTYRGTIYTNLTTNVVMIARTVGHGDIMRTLFANILINIDYIEHEETDMEVFVFRLQRELIPTERDYDRIAYIYYNLINLGIVIEHCTFVKIGLTGFPHGLVLIQLPTGMTIYTTEDKDEHAKNMYYTSDFIEKSVPKGMDYERVMRKIWTAEEMQRRVGQNGVKRQRRF